MWAAAFACKLGTDLNEIIALDVAAPDSLEQLDTLQPSGYWLDGRGTSGKAGIVWTTLDTAVLSVNATTGQTVVRHAGLIGRLQAQVGLLFSNPVSISTLFAADTLRPVGATLDSVVVPPQAPYVLSDTLQVQLLTDTATTRAPTDTLVPLAGRPIVFTIIYATPSSSVTLVTTDTAHAGVLADTVVTNFAGVAAVRLRFQSGPLRDTVAVTASARRARGAVVPGSPDTLVVRFHP